MSKGNWNRYVVLSGSPVEGATVTVEKESGGLAVLEDRSGSPITNPFTTGEDGLASFYTTADSSGFKVTIVSGSDTQILRNQAVGSAQFYDVGADAGGKLLTRDQMDARYGAVRFFGISGNVTLSATHADMTGLISDDADITLPEWSSVSAGYTVELLQDVRAAYNNTVIAQGSDIIRGGRDLLLGDGAVVRSSASGVWITVGEWDVSST